MKDKIKKTGEAVKETALLAGKKTKEGADVVSNKTSDTATATGNTVKKAGQSIKEKGGG